MTERRYTSILVFALVVAGAATFGIYRVLEASKAQNRIETRPVVVADHDITEGEGLDRGAVTVAYWPAAAVPPGAFGTADSVVGRVARIAVFKGEAIVPGRLAPDGTGPGLQVKIAPGKRAIAVRIDDVAGLNGLIQPNSRVDVLVTLKSGDGQTNPVAKLFMENMRVLSVGTVVQTTSDNRPISAPTATLEVTPEQAEQLAIAQREGVIQLALRGYGDPDSIKTRGARSEDVLAQLRNAPVVQAAPVVERKPAPRPMARPAPSVPQPVVQTPAPAPVASAPPPKPDSLSVQVFRGEKVTQHKFAKKDSVKP